MTKYIVKSGKDGYIDTNELKATHKDRFVYLNQIIIEKNKVSEDNVLALLHSHVELLRIKSNAIELDPKTQKTELKNAYRLMVAEFEKQQGLWGFEINPHFHEFWTAPHCSCPKKDNIDEWQILLSNNLKGVSYTPHYYRSKKCPVHGDHEDAIDDHDIIEKRDKLFAEIQQLEHDEKKIKAALKTKRTELKRICPCNEREGYGLSICIHCNETH